MTPPTDTSTPSRQRARKGEGDKLRAEILRVAERLLVKAGSKDDVSIRAIADECKCTPPAIYMHFADKDQLFLEVCSQRFREMDEVIERAARDARDPLEGLRLRGGAYVRFGLEHPEAYRLLMMTLHDGNIDEPGMEAGRDAFLHMVESVDRCVKTGALGDVDAYETSLVLWAAIHGLTSLLISFPNFHWGDIDRLIDLVLDVQIEGLLST